MSAKYKRELKKKKKKEKKKKKKKRNRADARRIVAFSSEIRATFSTYKDVFPIVEKGCILSKMATVSRLVDDRSSQRFTVILQ
ncbi:hypothetical protein ANTPLA_LOCUS6293 [Anthophora plagiata]